MCGRTFVWLIHVRGRYIDLFSFHGVSSLPVLEYITRDGGNMGVANRFKEEGKIRHVGFSTHGTPKIIKAIIETDKFDYVNLHYHYFGSYHASGYDNGEGETGNLPNVALAKEKDMGVFVISPFDKGGKLYKPTEKVCELVGTQMSPMIFAAHHLWNQDVDTISVGVAKKSDFDEVVYAARFADDEDVKESLNEEGGIEERLLQAANEALGEEWVDQYVQAPPRAHMHARTKRGGATHTPLAQNWKPRERRGGRSRQTPPSASATHTHTPLAQKLMPKNGEGSRQTPPRTQAPHTRKHTRTPPYTPAHTHTHPHTPAHTHTHPHTPAHTHPHTPTRTHPPAHTRTHPHTHLPRPHTHLPRPPCSHCGAWRRYWNEMPDMFHENSGGVAAGHILWCYNLVKSFGMIEFAQERYASLEAASKAWKDKESFEVNTGVKEWSFNPGKCWEEGINFEKLHRRRQGLLHDKQNYQMKLILKDAHMMLTGKRKYSDKDKEILGYGTAYNMQTVEDYPGWGVTVVGVVIQNLSKGLCGAGGGKNSKASKKFLKQAERLRSYFAN